MVGTGERKKLTSVGGLADASGIEKENVSESWEAAAYKGPEEISLTLRNHDCIFFESMAPCWRAEFG